MESEDEARCSARGQREKQTCMCVKKKEMSENSQPRVRDRPLLTQGDERVGLFSGHEAPFTWTHALDREGARDNNHVYLLVTFVGTSLF